MSQEEFQMLLQFFKVLADENRLRLLGILANGERSVEELAALVQLKAPTVSHHLARLKELNLVEMRLEGNTHYYQLNSEALRQFNKQLLTPEKMATLVDNVEGDAWERKVLRDFFDGERLKEIPASVKKRNVILKWFASQFEHGVRYSERQVNEIIQRHHPDSAFFRRELVDSRAALMQRDNAIYWRVSPELGNEETRRWTLEHIAKEFEPFKSYHEEQVNAIIQSHSPDYPFLRRELVVQNLLFRHEKQYVYEPLSRSDT